MNEPQLTAEMEKQIDKILVDMEKHYCRLNGQDDGYLVKKTTMRNILATVLEEQRETERERAISIYRTLILQGFPVSVAELSAALNHEN